ncbi:MAG: TRIC cation channel family protein, partial [Actinomycetes bacterium]
AIVLAIVGSVTGGLFRDILCQVQPVLLHRETVGTSALAGGLVYLSLAQLNVNDAATAIISGLTVVLVREISIKFNWNLPKVVSR